MPRTRLTKAAAVLGLAIAAAVIPVAAAGAADVGATLDAVTGAVPAVTGTLGWQ